MKKLLLLSFALVLIGAGCTSKANSDFQKKLSCSEQTPSFRVFLDDHDASVTEKYDESPDYLKNELSIVCYSKEYNTCVAQVLTNYDDRDGIKAYAADLYDMFTFKLIDTENTLDVSEREVAGVDFRSQSKMHCIYP